MRFATVDGLVTLFYDGSKELWIQDLHDEWWEQYSHYVTFYGSRWEEYIWDNLNLSEECKEFIRERLSWQQIIVVDGVTEIPTFTFYQCKNIKQVIFADTVIRIEKCAFYECKSLCLIKWSLNLEFIGEGTFEDCNLSSVFIPPRCRFIGYAAFSQNSNLTILNVPQDTHLGLSVIFSTKLNQSSWAPRSINSSWLKNINNTNQFALHRVCSSFEPTYFGNDSRNYEGKRRTAGIQSRESHWYHPFKISQGKSVRSRY
ncbi:hypothetical protein CTEN210_00322 [Chaetoceros tenuissimus]|uniref:Uncharacterized protein n=1 Tax=Chaetoceros tenuissimus TaxID=426638 RepID=A0AAD3GZ16_9STRA|nr:hypothetical protein CTEN210_00322 [Chaetoceros tenuissimus]